MIWTFFGIVAVGLVAVIAALVTSRWRYDPMSDPTTSVADPGLPDVVHAGDVDNVRFDTALRGYRVDQVDDVLDRLRDRLRDQETMIRALRAEVGDRPRSAVEEDTRSDAEPEAIEPEADLGPADVDVLPDNSDLRPQDAEPQPSDRD